MQLRTFASERARGFTLIEVLVVLTVLSILAAIGVPQYSRYVQRGRVVEATQALSDYRVRMEQWYQDRRSYQFAPADATCGVRPGTTDVPRYENFTLTCATANAGQSYVATMTGTQTMIGFVYTINQAGARATTSLPASFGALPADANTRWVTR